ncbi:BldC family transcriptional regulator [Streptosporangium amethystogenes subsp. fukuiense]|uniref:BldC family transcriptional regulator n=1 Tax=Streptosporangium amethystogenes subsp. fukuiense TaxID=698418 RepID=A0ABW2T6R7_9ACTN
MSAADHRKADRFAAASDLMTPGEVAAAFRVDPKTVTRWAQAGRIESIRTPGGHRRFRREVVEALLRGDSPQGGEA